MKSIKDLRNERDMTQLEVAIAVGVTPVTVYNWERGQHEPTARQLRAVARVLGVSMDDIEFEVPDKGKAVA